MKANKIYVITLSRVFPKTHYRSGDLTEFGLSLLRTLEGEAGEKIHTIRSNYYLWKRRVDEINAGRAILSIRQWIGAPYRSKQIEIAQLTKVGIECLVNMNTEQCTVRNFEKHPFCESIIDTQQVAANDHLPLPSFDDWFKLKPTCANPFAVLHFTDFRYNNSTLI